MKSSNHDLPASTAPGPEPPDLDRRSLLARTGLGLGALMAALPVARLLATPGRSGAPPISPQPVPIPPQPLCQTPASADLPAHLTSTDPFDPNAFPVYAWLLTRAMGDDCVDVMLDEFDKFLIANKTSLETSQLVYLFNLGYQTGTLPTSIAEFAGLAMQGLTTEPPGPVPAFAASPAAASAEKGGALCIEGPNSTCIDTGCSSKPGWCWSVPALIQELGLEPCECVLKPKWYEVALIVLILAILILTPGPDEIPAIMATIGRYIVRRVPVPVGIG